MNTANVSEDSPIQPGDLVVPTEKGLRNINKLYPQIRLGSQLRAVEFTGKQAYGRKAVFVIDKPGADPICVWRNHIKRLPAKAPVSDVWANSKEGLAKYIP